MGSASVSTYTSRPLLDVADDISREGQKQTAQQKRADIDKRRHCGLITAELRESSCKMSPQYLARTIQPPIRQEDPAPSGIQSPCNTVPCFSQGWYVSVKCHTSTHFKWCFPVVRVAYYLDLDVKCHIVHRRCSALQQSGYNRAYVQWWKPLHLCMDHIIIIIIFFLNKLIERSHVEYQLHCSLMTQAQKHYPWHS